MKAEEYRADGQKLAEAVKRAYAEGQTDYSLEPMSLYEEGKAVGKIKDGDSVIFCCRRGEREVELTELFTDADSKLPERSFLHDLDFVILTRYHEKFQNLPIAFGATQVQKPLAEVLSHAGKTQFHCSESEKFAHVTFFLNGGYNQACPGETDVCVPSIHGIPFDQKPELSLPETAGKVTEALGHYDFIVTNFANGDVIGHTANDAAKIQAAGCVSQYLGQVVDAALAKDYVVAVTADHGNIEVLHTASGSPHVAHTSNPVSFILIDPRANTPVRLNDGSLSDIAPTVLQVMGIPQPVEMTGKPLSGPHDFGKDRKMILIICDGWGQGDQTDNDAIFLADTPYWDRLLKEQAHSLLHASGTFVGLEEGKPGNSEAGHSNIGAGRVVPQDDIRLDQAIRDGSFCLNPVILQAIERAHSRGSALHLIGLLSYKSSHGSIAYPLAVCEMAKTLPEIDIHLIFDGRSTEPGSAPELLAAFDAELKESGLKNVRIVDGVGRGIALDRDKNYEKVKRAYEAMVSGSGTRYE